MTFSHFCAVHSLFLLLFVYDKFNYTLKFQDTENFTAMSNKSVWWKCPKGSDHEWQAKIANRSLGTNCPMCAGKKVSKTNNLIITNPKLASEWHQSLNKELKPEEFTFGSSKKVWWKCPMGDDHEWKTSINNRTKPKGTSCPFCLGGVILN